MQQKSMSLFYLSRWLCTTWLISSAMVESGRTGGTRVAFFAAATSSAVNVGNKENIVTQKSIRLR